MIKVADRIADVKEYYFSKKLDEIRAMVADGKDVINLGIGSPDLPPAPEVAEELVRSASDATNHAYQSYRSIPELREAIAAFYQSHYDVELNPVSEILPLLGSKEGVMYISMAFLNAGDTVLIPNPGYPAYKTAAEMMGAKVVFYDLKEENGWVPQFDQIDAAVIKAAKMMWVNYPNMPTGKKANKEILAGLAEFANQNEILVINDNPYSFILNDNPLSLLSIPGSKENCLELNSMSKAFNMAGWRVGMVSGRQEYIDAILRVKSNVDSGMFRPVQDAAVKALSLPKEWFESINKEYQQRRLLAEQLLDILECQHDEQQSGMFLWARIPEGRQSEEFVDEILQNKYVFITPGTIFGSNGEGYIRISLCSTQDVLRTVLGRLETVKA
ncbi:MULTISPECIES: pyridoxal phosphate-dependent aminotransferase [Reichenbachiella]|uniref:Aminotransferase n=1 Tax=Reichenbachiella agariperforans TaxID=156994 RepID=A0A1M6KQT2_REIAG|nr:MULTISPECIES: aminotransferase class I/II-fold pyridoxal phosphate-dependent enzyme [Reichenbachiella]MBU2913652.1 aminotransferase class I/II-fold pyridoxal phosphate-dependent enzyme [Reichenbachiella agariperforans]RJE74397.1 aminotransferase [Reichenbachiella sp. MSK19-1]SHJ61295.1 Aspartate/methionine/tyrosine aminotransferase [Reichenbachiella agariperforans]